MIADLERAHALDALTRTEGWRILTVEFDRKRQAAHDEALAAATDTERRPILAERWRTLDDLMSWPARTAAEIYQKAARKERVSG